MKAKDVLFVFVVLVAIQCTVSDSSKKGACKSRKDCNFLGTCVGRGQDAHCKCVRNVRGDHCEIIKGCDELCGSIPGVGCHYNPIHQVPFCFCMEEGERYDTQQKKCVKQKPCTKINKCENGGFCITESQSSYCQCLYGTGGDFCEIFEECVNNPNMCGDGADVECKFNHNRERAYCHCKNSSQRFDLPQRKCVDRTPCKGPIDCLPHGECTNKCIPDEPCEDFKKLNDIESCHCVEGTSGVNCEVIDDCFNNEVNCGDDGSAYCSFLHIPDFRNKALCKCKDPSKEFDYDKLTCN